jgi:stalled ribosome rescue protein Dom34
MLLAFFTISAVAGLKAKPLSNPMTFGFQHHLIHRKEAHYKGDHVPEADSYYEEIAVDLVQAKAIILIGHGTGKGSAVRFLTEYLKAHRPEEFQRIVATETADLSALTEPQIEEIVKRHIGGRP